MSSNASPLALFTAHPHRSECALESAHTMTGSWLAPQYCSTLIRSGETSLLISAYNDTKMIFFLSSVCQVQHIRSLDEYAVIGQIFMSGVARIAALAFGSAKSWVPRGREPILPLCVHGSCKKTNRGELLQFTILLNKLAVANLDFCKLSCLKETNVSVKVKGLPLKLSVWGAGTVTYKELLVLAIMNPLCWPA